MSDTGTATEKVTADDLAAQITEFVMKQVHPDDVDTAISATTKVLTLLYTTKFKGDYNKVKNAISTDTVQHVTANLSNAASLFGGMVSNASAHVRGLWGH